MTSPSPENPAAPTLDALIARSKPRFRTATEFVEFTLRDGILSGAIPGGTPLRQEELAQQFGVSRMPVREALRQLESQALIDFTPHKGAVVTSISAADASDLFAVRMALEPAALRLSLPHLTQADLLRATDAIHDMDQERDLARMGDLNRRFHMTLYAQANSPRLLALVEQHMAVFDRYLRFELSALGWDHLKQDDHHALLAACAAQDITTAEAVLIRHLATADQALREFFARRQDKAGETG
ncbi:GntR family transcriptional regulator [Insolitispirillum peregrinum]|uniref:GntR family transcriptional regulator n=1 Tax=Insolitispirillum peregrinum TaxID=80876 RepID=UPI00361648A4